MHEPTTTIAQPQSPPDGVGVERPCAAPAPTAVQDNWLSGRSILRTVALSILGLGLFLVSFSAFQIWGTDLVAGNAQDELAAELEQALQARRSPLPSRASPEVAATEEVPIEPAPSSAPPTERLPGPPSGSPIARIQAPSIGLDNTVVEGVGRVQLRDGPGHYPNTPLPGHQGHVAVAGHRTTHGSPFGKLDELEPGDDIILETVDGRFVYTVEAHYDEGGTALGHRIVAPDELGVLADLGDNRLTLTSCHPRYSNRQRLVVSAVLTGDAVAAPAEGSTAVSAAPARPLFRADSPSTTVPVAVDIDPAFGWQWNQLRPTLLWLFTTLLVACLSIYGHRRIDRLVLTLPLAFTTLVPLFNCFVHLDRLLPAY